MLNQILNALPAFMFRRHKRKQEPKQQEPKKSLYPLSFYTETFGQPNGHVDPHQLGRKTGRRRRALRRHSENLRLKDWQ